MIECAIYARVSTDKQAESVDHQVSLLKELAETKGENWQVRADCVYEDEGVSATKYSIWSRPAMRRLLYDADRGLFQVVMFKGISRLARNTHEALDVLERLKSKGLRVISYEESYDSQLENSNFLFTMHAAIAEYEAEKISIRVRLGNKEKAKSGRWTGGTPPDGYLLGEDGKLVVDEQRAQAIRQIFSWYTQEELGYGKIAARLNQIGHLTAMGGMWYASGVARILKNEVYTGALLYNRRQDKSVRDYESEIPGKKKEVRIDNPREAWVVVDHAHSPLVSKETFALAQSLRLEHRRCISAGPRAYHLFTGILRCGRCGQLMVCQKRVQAGREYRYYVCKTYHQQGRLACSQPSLPATDLESAVTSRLSQYLCVAVALESANPTEELTLTEDQTLLAALLNFDLGLISGGIKWNRERWLRRFVQKLVVEIVVNGSGVMLRYSFHLPRINGNV